MTLVQPLPFSKYRKPFTHLTLVHSKAHSGTVMPNTKRVAPIDPARRGPKAGVTYASRGDKKTMKFRPNVSLAAEIEREAELYNVSVSDYIASAIETFIREGYRLQRYKK